MKFVTVFTPTYNRGYILPELYESLQGQTCKDFKWIIIDDDSTDDTEQIVSKFIEKSPDMTIIYKKQNHGGKHRAINKGVKITDSPYFFIVDSDDKLTSDAIEFICKNGKSILNNKFFSGIAGLRITNKNKVIGGKPEIKGDFVDCTNFDRKKYNLLGDKAEVYKTEVLKKFTFPEFKGENFITEAVVWDRIAYENLKIRWFNKPIYICDYLNDGLTKGGANELKGHINNYQGYLYYIKQCQKITPFNEFIRNFKDYLKTADYLNKSIPERCEELNFSRSQYNYYKFLVNCGLVVKKMKESFK